MLAISCVVAGWASEGAQPTETLLAVVTQKGGFAKGRAHDHLISAAATGFQWRLEDADPANSNFDLSQRVEQLVVDPAELRQRWGMRLFELGWISEPFGVIEDKDREKIRSSMLSSKQLDAQRFPELSVRLVGIEEDGVEVAGQRFDFRLRVEMTVHGQTQVAVGGGRILGAGQQRRVEAIVPFLFSDFGIKPFSAFAGAVKNLDEFFLVAFLPVEQ